VIAPPSWTRLTERNAIRGASGSFRAGWFALELPVSGSFASTMLPAVDYA
jgi:hypothetical protein